jgi:hypothetical protein
MGHTHHAVDGNTQPAMGDCDPRRYFNPGSWVPHIHVGNTEKLSIAELRARAANLSQEALTPRYLHVSLGPTLHAELLPVSLEPR